VEDWRLWRFFATIREENMGKQKLQHHLALWADLELAGIPLAPVQNRSGFDAEPPLTITLGRDHSCARIKELKNGSFGYILPVFVRRNLPGETIIRDVWIQTSWFDNCIEWIDYPRFPGSHPDCYFFAGDTERFSSETVLNHQFLGTLSKGNIREGLLLANGLRPPDEYKHNDAVTIILNILDQWDALHSAELQIKIKRLPKRRMAVNSRPRRSLLARPDIIVPPRSYIAPPAPKEMSQKELGANLRRFQKIMRGLSAKHKHTNRQAGSKAHQHVRQ